MTAMNVAFDTLKTAQNLEQAGFERKQAEAIADAVKSAQGDLATKEQLNAIKVELKGDINSLRMDIKSLRWMPGLNSALVIAMLTVMLANMFSL